MIRKTTAFACALVLLTCQSLRASEGATSFWLPGQLGSFAASPGDKGWSLPLVYYHATAGADANTLFETGGRVTVGLDARANLFMVAPTFVVGSKVAGGQASVGVTVVVGHMNVSVDGTVTGPHGNAVTGAETDSVAGLGDLYPTASLKWGHGTHNFLAYTMAGVPTGVYEVGQLANMGTNHWALDGGGGYTYLDPAKGHEFSAVFGLTGNFENPDTQYKNGVEGHLDWAASQFLSEQLHVGLSGYFFHQLTGDSGAGAKLGDFKGQVSGIGPQVGYFFTVGQRKWYVNAKGFYEFSAKNRPAGWNGWLTLAIPLGRG